MILLIDNYDSFTYNLYQMLGELNEDIRVIRNDEAAIEDIRAMKPSGIVLSPGPGRPEDSGICPEVIREMRGELPILGICLGEQAIVIAYGGNVGYAERLMHGKSSRVEIRSRSRLFKGITSSFKAARYHSLAAEEESLVGSELLVTAVAEDGEIMALEDRKRRVYGLQFHPESILTPDGSIILRNFLEICEGI